jgi:zinc/manganese transport system permease protein
MTMVAAGMTMLSYDFMRTALASVMLAGVLAGCVGYFLMLREQGFAAHALSHVGFSGAAAALLLGVSPFFGFLTASVLAGISMGALGARAGERDSATGIVLSFALGLGMFFLSRANAPAGQAMSMLFGNVFAVDRHLLLSLAGLTAITLLMLGVISRNLLFATLHSELAEIRGVNPVLVASLFMALVAVTVAIAAEITGALLIFTLLVVPPAIALRLTRGPLSGVLVSVSCACFCGAGGVVLAYVSDAPASFCISLVAVLAYLGVVLMLKNYTGRRFVTVL